MKEHEFTSTPIEVGLEMVDNGFIVRCPSYPIGPRVKITKTFQEAVEILARQFHLLQSNEKLKLVSDLEPLDPA